MRTGLLLALLLGLLPCIHCWPFETADVMARFSCSEKPGDGAWEPNSTWLVFWDDGFLFNNVLIEFRLPYNNTSVRVHLDNGPFGLRPMLSIRHYCNQPNTPIVHHQVLSRGWNRLGDYNLAFARPNALRSLT